MKLSVYALTLALNVAFFPSGAMAEGVLGTWRTEATSEGHLEIRIVACGEALCGEIIRARDPQGKVGPYELTCSPVCPCFSVSSVQGLVLF